MERRRRGAAGRHSTPTARTHSQTFTDALAVVTGAASGIGAATARALSDRGARVVLIDVDIEEAKHVASDIEAMGGWAIAYLADVSDRTAMMALASEIIGSHGPVDIVINNAGVGMSARFADMQGEDWDWIRSINLDGVVNGCAAFGTPMLRTGAGHVVNVSSGLAYTMRATEPAYVTTKAAVLALSRCLRSDWGSQGVGVSVICPGIISTPIFERTRLLGSQDNEKSRRRGQRIFGRGHAPEKVAKAICKAIEHDRGIVPVGWEARMGWFGNRFIPSFLEPRIARLKVV